MLTYSFEKNGKHPLYEQLYKDISSDILTGELKPEEKLPSKRSLSKHLGISVITVENAYEQLMAEGYIYSIPKKGFYVSVMDDSFNYGDRIEDRDYEENYPAIAEKEAAENMHDRKSPLYFVDFSSNRIDIDNFPFSIWAKLMREILRENQKELMLSSPSEGVQPLREAIAMHLLQYRGVSVSPEQIIVGAGTEYLYGLLIQLLGFEKNYGVENPGYHKITQIYQSHNVPCAFISMDKDGVMVSEMIKKKIDVMHISPSHHFPTGTVMPVARRYELLKWASASVDRYIIEDDYDSEFRMVGQPIPALQTIDSYGKVIYMNTFSKTLTSTVRISYMVLPEELLRRFHKKLSFYSCTVSNFEQYTLAKFIQDGYFEKHLNRMRTFYHGKRDMLLKAIKNSPLNQKVSILEEDAGLHFLLKIKTDLTDEEFYRKALEKGIKILPLSGYYHESSRTQKHTFIINYSSVEEEKMEEAVKRIHQILENPL